MKKILLSMCVSVVALTLACSLAFAQTGGFSENKASGAAGGFTGPGLAVSTVEQAKTMRDDYRIVLQGNIVQHLGGEKYLFKDNSGSITIEVDDDEWGGQTITPSDKIEIQGEVDKDWNSVEIDVKRLRKI